MQPLAVCIDLSILGTLYWVHSGGALVDYSGKKPHYVDPKTGDRVKVELFRGRAGRE